MGAKNFETLLSAFWYLNPLIFFPHFRVNNSYYSLSFNSLLLFRFTLLLGIIGSLSYLSSYMRNKCGQKHIFIRIYTYFRYLYVFSYITYWHRIFVFTPDSWIHDRFLKDQTSISQGCVISTLGLIELCFPDCEPRPDGYGGFVTVKSSECKKSKVSEGAQIS